MELDLLRRNYGKVALTQMFMCQIFVKYFKLFNDQLM